MAEHSPSPISPSRRSPSCSTPLRPGCFISFGQARPTGLWRTSTSRGFLFTKPAGIATLFFGISLIIAIVAVEAACLMAIGFGRAQGVTLNAQRAQVRRDARAEGTAAVSFPR